MEIFIFGYFLVGSFSLVLVLASVIESCSFLFAHNPMVLEGLGVATIVTAMLSLTTPTGSRSSGGGFNSDIVDVNTKHATAGKNEDEE